MRVAWFCGGYPPDRTGGVPSIMKQLVEGLRAKGHEVTVITPRFERRIRENGLVQFELPLPHLHENIHYGLWCLKVLHYFWKNRGKFDVHCGHMVWGFLACLLGNGKWVVVPHVATMVYQGWLESFAHKLNYWITRAAYRKADRIIAISDFMKQDLETNFPFTQGKVQRVYYGVDTDFFKPVPVRKDPGKKRLLYLARLRPEKGVEAVIKAFRLLEARGLANGLELVIAGGCSAAYLEYLQRTYPEARFLGSLSREQTREQYSQASLYLIPSVGESFCLSLVEAMGCELPVLCSDLPIFREITQGKAFFVPPANKEKWAERMVEVVQRSDLEARGKQMREIALNYQVENNVTGYERVLRELAGETK